MLLSENIVVINLFGLELTFEYGVFSMIFYAAAALFLICFIWFIIVAAKASKYAKKRKKCLNRKKKLLKALEEAEANLKAKEAEKPAPVAQEPKKVEPIREEPKPVETVKAEPVKEEPVKEVAAAVAPVSEPVEVEEPVPVSKEPKKVVPVVPVKKAPAPKKAEPEESLDERFARLNENKNPVVPFPTKILESDDDIKNYYNTVKNKLLSYDGIESRVSKKCDTFKKGSLTVAKITVVGKTLKLFLNLRAEGYETRIYHQENVGDKKAYEDVPMMVKIKSDRALRNALELVNDLAIAHGTEKVIGYSDVNFVKELKKIK